MATLILMLFVAILSVAIIPWIAQLNHYTLHKTDTMAGDEGE